MATVRRFSHLSRLLRNFAGAEHGNVAVIFAVASMAILAFVGVAIDYSRAVKAHASMQTALDSTALMLSRDLSTGKITSSQISSTAQAYFSGLFTDKSTQSFSVSATYTAASGTAATISLSVSGSIQSAFLQLIGRPNLGVNASSTTTWGAKPLRVALVLDNTGSMTDYNKIGALQSAATALVTQLSSLAQNAGDVYISVVPFAVDVNVGTANSGASWLRWDRWDPSMWKNQSNQTTWCSDKGNSDTLAQCQDHGYTWNHTPNTSNRLQWNGCVTDRDQSNDINAAPPSAGVPSTLFIVDQDIDCPAQAIVPLTNNWTAVKNAISAMSPNGATNQIIGLQWGWFSLLQQAPLNAPAEQAGASYQHIIILFTDGLNTSDRWYGDYVNPSPQVDARQKSLCDNMKAGGVTIFAVQIDTDHAGQSAVLPYCASDSNKFFMLTQPSQIATAFQQIVTQISMLRISK